VSAGSVPAVRRYASPGRLSGGVMLAA